MLPMYFILLATCLVILTLELTVKVWKRRKLPPGPIRWPIIGNLVEMSLADAKYPHLALAKLAEKYGDIMSFGFGVHDAVIVSSYEVIKELFTTDELSFARFDGFPYVADRAYNKNLGIIWGAGNVWREMRRFTFRTLKDLGFRKTKSMEATMLDESNYMFEFMKTTAAKNNGVFRMDNPTLAETPVNIMWGLVAGWRFPPGDEKLTKMLKYNNVACEIYGHSNVYSAYPFLKDLFPKWSQHEHHLHLHKDSQDFFTEIIESIQRGRYNRANRSPDNFIEAFVDEIQKSSGNPESNFTDQQLNVILADLFLGASETIYTTLKWAVLFLTLNPEVQRKLQVELKKTLGDDPVTLNDVTRLPYVKATIFEILRKSLIIPIPVPRKASSDIDVGGYTIPKGTCMFFNLHPIFNEVKYWKDPDVFRPERFLSENGKTVINTERIKVFGFGKRVCPGETFAMDCLFILLTTMVRKFKLEPALGEPLSLDNPICGLAHAPQPYSVKLNCNIEN